MKVPTVVSESSDILTQIYTTRDYSLFGYIGGNRNVNQSNLRKIEDSISKKHIQTNSIICILDGDSKSPLKIVDGQHRFEACKKLNKPVSYVIDHELTMKSILSDITLMNTASKEWDVSDFMRSESQQGNQNYILYQSVYNQFSHNFDHEALYFILNECGHRSVKLHINHPKFKDGKLTFSNSDYLYLMNRLTEIDKFNKYSIIGGKRYYQKALNTFMNVPNFDINHMLSRMVSFTSSISKVTTVEKAEDHLAVAYNWKLQNNKIKFGFTPGHRGRSISI